MDTHESPYVDSAVCVQFSLVYSQVTRVYTLIHACTGLYMHVRMCTHKCLCVDTRVLRVALNSSLTCNV